MTAEMPKPEDLTRRVIDIAAERAKSDRERFEISQRLLTEIEEQLTFQVKECDSEELLLSPGRPEGDRFAIGSKAFTLAIEETTYCSHLGIYVYFLGEEGLYPFPFRIATKGSSDSLDIRLEDLRPELSAGLKLRLAGWVRRRLADILKDLQKMLSPEDSPEGAESE